MKHMRYLNKIAITACLLASGLSLEAGNPQRAGSAGAPELLINPWARSSGWGGVNIAGVTGVESAFINIAGIASTEGTDVSFSNTQWLVGAGINVNAAGFAQSVGSNGVLSANFVSFDYGSWERTTVDSPDGGIGEISPSTAIIGLGYAQRFIKSIRGGVNLKIYTTSIVDVTVTSASVDAGVQYVTGKREQVKFGITLRNIGPNAQYEGEGQSITLVVPNGGYAQEYNERSENFELPTTLSIGGSYDFAFEKQRLTVAAAFQSNSFEKDLYTAGVEYSFKELLSVRAAYSFWDNRDFEATTTVFTGFSAGVSLDMPLSKNNDNTFGLDYSYRSTSFFDGVHSIGVSVSL
jgi:hypothetical protein